MNVANKCSAIFDKPTDSENYEEELSLPINSCYHDIHSFNQLKPDRLSSLGLIHTNLASIKNFFDNLNLILSLLKFDFHIIGISEHKIHKNVENPTSNISLEGYYPFEFDPTETTHGGTGFFYKKIISFY